MTGRENIYLNGAILGMTKQEITRKLDEIVDFAGVERYIDTPTKRYSSGMTVRLGFAIAAHLDPEILVVDEVLAVGDAEFQKKAIGKMQEVSQGEGRTVLFVSHNMSSISTLCKSCILLDKGSISYQGSTDDCINRYYSSCERGENMEFDINRDVEYLSRDVKVNDIKINGKDPAMINISDNGLIDIALDITISNRHDIYLAIMIYDGTNLVASYSSKSGSGKVFRLAEGQHNLQDMFYVPNNLVNGDYYLTVQINDANGGFLARMSRIVQLKKIGYISKYTGVSFTKSNSGYFAITDEN